MEDEVFEVVGKTGDNLLVRKHNEWPEISGHFEWYCNERLTTTQQMYDYVVSHRKAILKQMKAVRERGISREFDEASYFQDHYDDYLDDPEDEMAQWGQAPLRPWPKRNNGRCHPPFILNAILSQQ